MCFALSDYVPLLSISEVYMKRFFIILFAIFVSLSAFAKESASCKLISKQQAMERAKSQSGSKALSATLVQGKKPVYKVKVISDKGRIKTIIINACA